ncbi:MAG: hypothetical protein ABI520_14075 [Caldimonas sp.]
MDLKRVGFGDVLDNVEEADGRHGTCFTPAVSVGGTNDGLDAALLGVAGAGWARLDEGDLESRLLESHGHEPFPPPTSKITPGGGKEETTETMQRFRCWNQNDRSSTAKQLSLPSAG